MEKKIFTYIGVRYCAPSPPPLLSCETLCALRSPVFVFSFSFYVFAFTFRLRCYLLTSTTNVVLAKTF